MSVAVLVPAGLYVLRRVVDPDVTPAPTPPSGSAWTAPVPPAKETLLFAGVAVVDVAAGVVVRNRDVLVRDGRIAAVAPKLEAPRDARVIPGEGRYLMPGLIDTHVHVTADDHLFLMLAAGVTTVQGLGGPGPRNRAVEARRAAGDVTTPRYISCDHVVRGGSGMDATAVVRAASASGAECIKVYSPPDWTPAEHGALVDAAIGAGLRIGGHLPRNLPLEHNARHPQQFVAHAEEYLYAYFDKQPAPRDEAWISPAVEITRSSGSTVVPTLVAYRSIVEQVGPGIEGLLRMRELVHVQPEVLDSWRPPNNRYRQRFTDAHVRPLSDSFEYQRRFVSALSKAGVPLALGTDASPQMPFVLPGFSALAELEQLVAAGLTPAGALRAATIGGAQLLKRASELGQVAVGFRADLLLLHEDPLSDVRQVANRVGVVADGRWMAEEWLQQRLPRYQPQQ